MQDKDTPYGMVFVLEQEEIFQLTTNFIENTQKETGRKITVGLTGGSTPKAFYKWVVSKEKFSEALLNNVIWMTSDERCVPLDSPESNFGNADRMMIEPLNVSANNKKPWSVDLDAEDAAREYNQFWNQYFNPQTCMDVCLLGMGDDCHTASIFPDSPLIDIHSQKGENFAAVEVPGKGWRLSITPAGLARCGRILVTVIGKGKAQALKEVLEGPYDPYRKPAQLHKAHPEKVTWLVDSEASAKSSF